MEHIQLKNNEVLITKEIQIDQFINENEEMFKDGIFKLNLLPTILYELKHKYRRKWLVQCEGYNEFPEHKENEKPDNYDNWVYTDNIASTVEMVDNLEDCVIILDNASSWFRWVSANGTGIDCLADYTMSKDLKFLDEITQRPEFQI